MRVRIGIGHPGEKGRVHGHVLSDFSKADESWLAPLIDAIGAHGDLLAAGEAASFMNKVHLAIAPPEKKPAKTKSADTKKDD